jgi:hypothetical protein
MAYVAYNPNPTRKLVGDCVIRAISRATNKDWEYTYLSIVALGFSMHDMPSSNDVWGSYLILNGFKRYIIPDTCPECYRVADFCWDHPSGDYLLATGTHVIAVLNGDYYDTWDSGDEVPIYFYERR